MHWYNKKWFYKMLCWRVLSHYHFSFFFNISFTLRHSVALFFLCDIMKWWMDDMVSYWYADFQLFSAFGKSHKNGIVLIWRKRPKIWIFESALIIICVIRKWQINFCINHIPNGHELYKFSCNIQIKKHSFHKIKNGAW